MKKLPFILVVLLIFILAWVFSGPASAQSFPKPPDVPAYVPIAATYAAGTALNVLGDGSNAKGGTPPGYANELPNIPTPNPTSWMAPGTYGDAQGFCSVPNGTFNGHGCPEPKFRTHVLFSHVLFDDPIRNYGLPGTSHCHAFFGNRRVNAYTTYASLRNQGHTTAAGGDLNKTGYWAPCVVLTNPFSDGKNYAVKYDYTIVYYSAINTTEETKIQRLPYNFEWVFGLNMDDPDDTQVKKEIAAANVQPGTAGRYSYQYDGRVGWRCDISGTSYFTLKLKNADDSDGFNGITPGNTCPAGTLTMVIGSSQCWDGTNLWSPGGYAHLRQRINDNQAPGDHLVCPNHWYELPQLQIQFVFTQTGFADYGRWRLDSDDHAVAKLNALPACIAGYANAPCSDGGGVRTVQNGVSFHTDAIEAWDQPTMLTWEQNCLGIAGGTPHQCEPSIISSTEALSYGPNSDGFTLVDTVTYGTASAAKMVLIGSGTHNGPATIHAHGM